MLLALLLLLDNIIQALPKTTIAPQLYHCKIFDIVNRTLEGERMWTIWQVDDYSFVNFSTIAFLLSTNGK